VASQSRRVRRRRSRRLSALVLAAVANLAILSMLGLPGHGLRRAPAGLSPRTVEISLAPWFAPRLNSAAAAPPPKSAAPIRPSIAPAPSAPTVESAMPAAGGGTAPAPAAGALAATLRRGDVGCAHPEAPWMTQSDRDACRDRLAAGAAKAPYVSATAPEKLAYYVAVAKAQEDWRSGRDAGHLPFFYCGYKFGGGHVREVEAPPHALKLGPCFLEPPKGSLDIAVDIPMPGVATPDAVTPAGADPIRHIGQ
jgi:hypothetical protein